MLRSFRLHNHRSFRDEHELLLIPAYDHDRSTLPVVAIYGANASGKSNLLDGLEFMCRAVSDSFQRWDPDQGVPRRPFLLDPAAGDRPSTFVVEMVIDGVRHTYGFTVDGEQVGEEWLYSYPAKKKRILFERTGSDIKFGSTVAGLKGKLDILEELTRPNALFLSVAAQSNVEPLMPAYLWFRSGIRFHRSRSRLREHILATRLARLLEDHFEDYAKLLALLTAADVGINSLTVEFSEERKVWFLHGESHQSFGLTDESDGTRSWLELLLVVLDTFRTGGVLAVDEIDASLHPLLTARLVDLFRDPETNSHGAQLIFSTHDASLLGTALGEEVLARDQTWFVEKDETGASKLYPLSDFKPRLGENAERRYLGGSYGAVPVLDRHDFQKAMRDR